MLGYTTLWFIINRNTYFRLSSVFWHHISQGSVATYLRCGGIFKHDFITYIPLSLLSKKIKNWLIFGEVMGKSSVSCFLTHGVVDMIREGKRRWGGKVGKERNGSTTNSLSQITFATLAANLFRHYLQCCIAFYFPARGARCSCPFSSEIRGRTSITAFAPGRGKPLLCQWALDFYRFLWAYRSFACLFFSLQHEDWLL